MNPFATTLIVSALVSLITLMPGSAKAASILRMTLPPTLKMGVSASQTTVVIADPTRVKDPTAPVMIIQLVPATQGPSKQQTLQLLRDAQRAVAPTGADTLELEPIALKDGTPVPLTYILQANPYAGELYGLVSVPKGILFVRVTLHHPNDYALYAHYLKGILATIEIAP